MVLDVFFYMMAIPAVVFAGISKGGFGAAAAFASTPFLALILPPAQAVGLMLPLLMVMDVTALRIYWGKWDKTAGLAMILGSIPGILLGTILYKFTDPQILKLLIGLIAVGFVLYQLARKFGALRTADHPLSPAWGRFWGAVAGFTSFVSHAGGPPAAIYLLTLKLDKTTFQATTVLVFWIINATKVIPYTVVGIFDWATLFAAATLVPVAILAVFVGRWFHNNVSERLFFGMTYVFLMITGCKLIWDAVV